MVFSGGRRSNLIIIQLSKNEIATTPENRRGLAMTRDAVRLCEERGDEAI
jgi:hypothetical protein